MAHRHRPLSFFGKLGREVLTDDPALGDAALEPDVIEKLDAAAETGALKRCFKLLDDQQRRCIVLAFVEGLSHSEITERIGAPGRGSRRG